MATAVAAGVALAGMTAADAATRAAGTGSGASATAASAAAAPAADGPLSLEVSGAPRQAVLKTRALVVRVRCPLTACTAVASARARLPRAGLGLPAITIQTPARTVRLGSDVPRTLRLPLSEPQLRALAGRFAGGVQTRLTVHVRAHDDAGHHAARAFAITPTFPDA
ncbi:hypothetical protein Q5424_07850 [Conexibacter sp. JD483]|uniref:hypothetical protein n=1 Tax=unclassified Conexibacter TaxID=2627773 RepID=UPI002726756C|nr:MULTISPECIES: hypothetical protein [unclassified Conexibacter]MDO8184728.1 hypothetical protein [Conexibacter sp. CPCC 205706]MDO8196503.1 hypothetical protein [Conexibacter sp. CPCC 205762]MDR9368989.1 hypothetical protein [Conexibacter sp. JD483]